MHQRGLPVFVLHVQRESNKKIRDVPSERRMLVLDIETVSLDASEARTLNATRDRVRFAPDVEERLRARVRSKNLCSRRDPVIES
jgi:hypothetical protein